MIYLDKTTLVPIFLILLIVPVVGAENPQKEYDTDKPAAIIKPYSKGDPEHLPDNRDIIRPYPIIDPDNAKHLISDSFEPAWESFVGAGRTCWTQYQTASQKAVTEIIIQTNPPKRETQSIDHEASSRARDTWIRCIVKAVDRHVLKNTALQFALQRDCGDQKPIIGPGTVAGHDPEKKESDSADPPQELTDTDAKALIAKRCANCHGPKGKGNYKQFFTEKGDFIDAVETKDIKDMARRLRSKDVSVQMPRGRNGVEMREDERAQLAAWLDKK